MKFGPQSKQLSTLIAPSCPLLWIALVCLFAASPILAQTHLEGQKKVLVLFSLRAGAPLSEITEKALQRNISTGSVGQPDYYREYIDVVRFPDPEYQSALKDFLRRKYKHQTFDLIITVASWALDFVEQHGAELFPGVPVVFLGRGSSSVEELRSRLNCTGVFERVNLRSTMDLALKLQPATRQVFVVSGVSAFDKTYEDKVRQEARELDGRIRLNFLSSLPLEDILKTIANLPADSIIYYVIFTEDSAGNKFLAHESIQKVASAANAPVYIWFGGHMEPGVLGGSVIDVETMANQTAEMTSRVLRGEEPRNIPVIDHETNVNMLNWRQLRRWGINEKNLPPDRIDLFKDPTFWEQYKRRIIAMAAIIVVQTLLIAFLLIERDRRKRAKAALDDRLRFETLLSELSAEFTSMSADEVEGGIDKWVNHLGEFLGVDRSAFIEVPGNEAAVDGNGADLNQSIREWDRENHGEREAHGGSIDETQSRRPLRKNLGVLRALGGSLLSPNVVGFDLDVRRGIAPEGKPEWRLRWVIEQLRSGVTVNLPRVSGEPPGGAVDEEQESSVNGLKSLLAIPVSVNKDAHALIFASLQSYRDWPQDLVRRLRLAGEIFADAAARKIANERLMSEKLFSEATIDSLPGVFYHYDENGRFIKWNENFERVTGYTHEEIAVMHPLDFFAGSDRRLVEEQISEVFTLGEATAEANLVCKDGSAIPYFFTGRRIHFDGQPFLIGMGIDIAERMKAEAALKQLTGRLMQLQDDERRRIARELHDVTAQNVGTIIINLEGLLQNRFRPSDVLKIMTECRALGDQSLKELRTLSYLLHPPMLDQAGLVFALEWYIDGFIKRSGIHVSLVASPDLNRLPPEVEIVLFRIVQECLINIHRHSGSATAEIRLERRDGWVTLEVKDQGRGLPSNGKIAKEDDLVSVGVGIPGMRHRLSQLGGRLEIETSEGGVTVTAIVPFGEGGENG